MAKSPTPETRARIASALRGRRKSIQHRRKIAAALKGRPRHLTPETRARIAEATRARNRQAKHAAKAYSVTWPDGRSEVVHSLRHWCQINEEAFAPFDAAPASRTPLHHRVAAGLQQVGKWREFTATPIPENQLP